MEAVLKPATGFEPLITQINEGVIYVDITGYLIKAIKVLNIAARMAICSGIFAATYKEWHRC